MSEVDDGAGQGAGLSSEQLAAASRLGMAPAWYRVWVDAAFTAEQIAAWYPLTHHRGPYPQAAVRLVAHGWGPSDLRRAIEQLASGWPHITAHDVATGEAQAVLWEEVAEYHRAQAALAKDLHQQSLAVARAAGGTLKRLARVTGRSVQHIHQLTRGVWPVPPAPPSRPPSAPQAPPSAPPPPEH